jgi:hypothetical protein
VKTLIDGPKLDSLLELAERVKGVPGCIAEFGVYHGGTLKRLAEKYPGRRCIGYDTWEGMPAESWTKGELHGIGSFHECDFDTVKAGMPSNVELIRGRFPDTATLISTAVAFAHVDFDLQVSTADAIAWLKPRMSPGAIAVFDDYAWPYCPGVTEAIKRSGIDVAVSTNHQVFWVNGKKG